jgi:hypothetical protein
MVVSGNLQAIPVKQKDLDMIDRSALSNRPLLGFLLLLTVFPGCSAFTTQQAYSGDTKPDSEKANLQFFLGGGAGGAIIKVDDRRYDMFTHSVSVLPEPHTFVFMIDYNDMGSDYAFMQTTVNLESGHRYVAVPSYAVGAMNIFHFEDSRFDKQVPATTKLLHRSKKFLNISAPAEFDVPDESSAGKHPN